MLVPHTTSAARRRRRRQLVVSLVLCAVPAGATAALATPVGVLSASAAAATAGAPARSAGAVPSEAVGVTTAGAVVVLSLSGGRVLRTLVAHGAVGDGITVSPDGRTVYFATASGCDGSVDSVPLAGGPVRTVTSGSDPALTPRGDVLAVVRQTPITDAKRLSRCLRNGANPAAHSSIVLRRLATGTERSIPIAPSVAASGLPQPISHLSFAPDGRHLLATSPSIEDNEGWKLVLVDTATARYWLSPSTRLVPVAGSSKGWYSPEAVFEPDGLLFQVRQCCSGLGSNGGTPVSVLLEEASPSTGAVVHQVALGYASRSHTSLDAASSSGALLYLSGNELFVSRGGATPVGSGNGLIAAAFVP